MFSYFSAKTAQIKNKRALKVDKKEAVKNDIRYRTCKQYIVQIKQTILLSACSLHLKFEFETILIVFTFIGSFDITIPVSYYLHKSGLNIMQAYHMINKAMENIEKISRDFSDIF